MHEIDVLDGKKLFKLQFLFRNSEGQTTPVIEVFLQTANFACDNTVK